MKRTTAWAAATLVAAVAALPLAPAYAGEPSPSAAPATCDMRLKTGRSGRLYVWRPGGC